MFEIDDPDPVTKSLVNFTKNVFEILRNIIVVSTLKFIAIKANDQVLLNFCIFLNVLLGLLGAHMFTNISFSKRFFAQTRGAQIFRIAISGLLIFPFFLLITLLMNHVIQAVISTQLVSGSSR